eukprot:3323175-Rhodomonas_salina.2
MGGPGNHHRLDWVSNTRDFKFSLAVLLRFVSVYSLIVNLCPIPGAGIGYRLHMTIQQLQQRRFDYTYTPANPCVRTHSQC